MKKILLVGVLVSFLAAGCDSSQPVAQNNPVQTVPANQGQKDPVVESKSQNKPVPIPTQQIQGQPATNGALINKQTSIRDPDPAPVKAMDLKTSLELSYSNVRTALLNKNYQGYLDVTAADDIDKNYPPSKDDLNQITQDTANKAAPDLKVSQFIKIEQSGDWAGYYFKVPSPEPKSVTLCFIKYHLEAGQWKVTKINVNSIFTENLETDLKTPDFLLPGQQGYISANDISSTGISRGGVVLVKDSNGAYITTRVIGLPGEKMSVDQGKVFANDKELSLSYFSSPLQFQVNAILGKDEYLVVGKRSSSFKWDYSTYIIIKGSDIIAKTSDQ